MNTKGFEQRTIAAFKEELSAHETAVGDDDDVSGMYLDGNAVEGLKRFANIDETTWNQNELGLRRELRKGRRDFLSTVLSDVQKLEHYTFDEAPQTASPPSKVASLAHTTLECGITDFISEQSRQWAPKTTKQNQAYLNVMLEYFGKEKPLTEITKRDASALKKVLQAMPSSRNTKPALKDLPLMEAIKVEGHKKISPRTVNSHIQMFASFFDWAERHGHAKEKLFVGMKVAKAKKSGDARKPFTQEQAKLIYTELVRNTSGYVRNESHKWGMLLALYTGGAPK